MSLERLLTEQHKNCAGQLRMLIRLCTIKYSMDEGKFNSVTPFSAKSLFSVMHPHFDVRESFSYFSPLIKLTGKMKRKKYSLYLFTPKSRETKA